MLAGDDDDEGRCAATATATTTSHRGAFNFYVCVHNVAKKHNVGTVARSATAFGAKSVVLIGSRQFNTFGAQGSDNHVDFEHFESLQECRRVMKDERGCTQILGVEIVEGARAVHEHPFTGHTAFILGNEGHGLTEQQKAICDGYVYIPQYGSGTASLNVSVAASIVMHHFALWAQYEERAREGEKFVVAERRQRTSKRGVIGEHPDAVRARRAAARLAAQNADKDDADADGDGENTESIVF